MTDVSRYESCNESVAVLGSPITLCTEDSAVRRITEWSRAKVGRVVCICNVHSVVTARVDPEFSEVLAQSDMNTPDGAPVAWLMRKLGFREQLRVNGPDLMLRFCDDAQTSGVAIFLYGASDDVLSKLEAVLVARYPRLIISGKYSPPYRSLTEEEDREIVDMINSSGAGVVWVGLGCPKQEKWMQQHRGSINAVMIGVGAAFDYHAGAIQRAPVWMRDRGLEWLHRLVSEPRRLWKRYLHTNSVFIVLAVHELFLYGIRRLRFFLRG